MAEDKMHFNTDDDAAMSHTAFVTMNNNRNINYINNNHIHNGNINNNNNNNNNTINDDDNNSFIISPDTAATGILSNGTTTYDTSQRPYKHDKRRGQWSSGLDFYCASIGHTFGSIMFSDIPFYVLFHGGFYCIPAFLIGLILYAMPIFVIQTFLGQFSTSGALSAFRVSPLFKGLGYSMLVLNLASLTYYAVIAGVPLVYAANSLHSVIPWMSCDNSWNSKNCSTHNDYDMDDIDQDPHSTVEFFHFIIRSADTHSLNISWPVFWGMTGACLITLTILLKNVSFIGKFFCCTTFLKLSILLAIFVYLIFEHEISWATLFEYFKPFEASDNSGFESSIKSIILFTVWLLGPGFGNVLTMGSYNTFRKDTERITYWVGITYFIVTMLILILGRIAVDHFELHVGMIHYHIEEEHSLQYLYLWYAYLFGSAKNVPNLWSFLFFAMLFLSEINVLVVQMMSVLTAIFDEYEKLRYRKTTIKIAFVLLMLLSSTYFCTKQGFEHLHVLPMIFVFIQIIISLVLLMMTTWIYGRKRFQCDLQFMLGKTISNFKIFLIRFLTPALAVALISQVFTFFTVYETPPVIIATYLVLVFALAPSYAIYKMTLTTGSLKQRLKQCFAPHDWHPVDADNRRYYEEIMGVSEMLVIDSEQ